MLVTPADLFTLARRFDNGVVDLQTCSFLEGRPEHFISKSVGYDFVPASAIDPKIQAQVEDCLTKIYPVGDEREVVQRYGGYCLLGHHPEKKLLILTDARSGYNGKPLTCPEESTTFLPAMLQSILIRLRRLIHVRYDKLATPVQTEPCSCAGKSTWQRMMMTALGPQYSIGDQESLLYRADLNCETVNSHKAGALPLESYSGCNNSCLAQSNLL